MFHILNNICTLDGGAALAKTSSKLQQWYKAMESLPAVASYLETRPKAGSGEVGQPGSIISSYAVPSERPYREVVAMEMARYAVKHVI